MSEVDVLIPAYGRAAGLAVVLTSLLGQTFSDFNVIISDQTEHGPLPSQSIEVQALARALRRRGHAVNMYHHLPRRGLAEQRRFLLEQSSAPYVHYLDDDVLLDAEVMARMLDVLKAENCGFVGCAATGLEYLEDVRPHQQQFFERWDGPVRPEPLTPDTLGLIWARHEVNNAANPLHLEQQHCIDGATVRYKIAWIGGANVLYDRAKLLSVGGFSWWERMPPEHAGEEVVVQFLLIRKYGGCGLLPSGTYHLGLPTTIVDRRRNATELFAKLIAEYDVQPVGEVAPLPLAREVAVAA